MSTNPAALSNEVRACPKCGQTSVVLVFEWKHTTYGTATGQTTRDFRCQSCGAKFTIRPWANTLGLWVAGVILLMTCVPGLVVLFVAWRRSQVEKSIPVVPGAPMPQMRFRGGPPLRSCAACSGLANTIRVTRSSHNGIPTGTEYEYRCTNCSKTFVIESPLGQIFALFSGAVLAGIGALLVFYAEKPIWRWGASSVLALLGVFLALQTARRFLNRFRNPVTEVLS